MDLKYSFAIQVETILAKIDFPTFIHIDIESNLYRILSVAELIFLLKLWTDGELHTIQGSVPGYNLDPLRVNEETEKHGKSMNLLKNP